MFVYKKWDEFCKRLNNRGVYSVTASSLIESNKNQFFVLKHDVETKPRKALVMAKIENKYDHKGTYYVQGYILNKEKNIRILEKIQNLGHEVSYHHDVMDANNGDIVKAKVDFSRYKNIFEKNGFQVTTVCQHGNPIIQRNGYYSNRDFFRNKMIHTDFPNVFDIMVNYKSKIGVDYDYISDAGYSWKLVSDPENNDINDASKNDIAIDGFVELEKWISINKKVLLSTHPHRWHSNRFSAKVQSVFFKSVKIIAKYIIKVPGMKKLLSKFYYLAKKI